MRNSLKRKTRRGSITVLAAMLIVVIVACLAFAIDLGQIHVTQSELQNAVDAACLAAVRKLPAQTKATAVTAAQSFAAANHHYQAGQSLLLVTADDVEPGTWDSVTRVFTSVVSAHDANAVRVTVRRATTNGNPLQLAFGGVLGVSQTNVTASAVATYKFDWRIVAANKLQIGEHCSLSGIGAYGRQRVEIGGDSEVIGGSKIGALPGSVIQYSGTTGLPENIVRADLQPGLANNVAAMRLPSQSRRTTKTCVGCHSPTT